MPDAAGGFYAVDQLRRNFALIEAIAAMASHGAQRVGQLGLLNQGPCLRKLAVAQENSRRVGVAIHHLKAVARQRAVMFADGKTIFGGSNGRRQRLAQRQLAIVLGQVCQRGGNAGNACRHRAIDGRVALHHAIAVAVQVAAGAERRGFASVNKTVGLVAVTGLTQQKKTAAAQAGAVGLNHRQR